MGRARFALVTAAARLILPEAGSRAIRLSPGAIGRNAMTRNADPAERRAQVCFVLGTVQLGMTYGAANATGMPTERHAMEIVHTAIERGIRWIDTARDYRYAERRIGQAVDGASARDVQIITKLDPLRDVPSDAPPASAVAAAVASLAASREALRRDRIDALLLHRAVHRTAWHGEVWRFLRAERDAGRIVRLGVSVQSPQEALAVLADYDVEHIQLPFNILDHRWNAAGIVDALRTRSDITVHARSVLLQGLLTGAPHARWPALTGISPTDIVERLRIIARELGREDTRDLAIAYVRAQDWIDGVVIGVETKEQLLHNLALFERPPLGAAAASALADIPHVPEALLDPAQWPDARTALTGTLTSSTVAGR